MSLVFTAMLRLIKLGLVKLGKSIYWWWSVANKGATFMGHYKIQYRTKFIKMVVEPTCTIKYELFEKTYIGKILKLAAYLKVRW